MRRVAVSKEEFPSEKHLTEGALKAKTAPANDAVKTAKDEAPKAKDKKSSDLSAKVAKLQAALTAAEAAQADLDNKYLRSEAELQNVQKRHAKERSQLIKYESQNLAKAVLPAVDNLERALATSADDEHSRQLKKGVQMTLDALVKALEEQGIETIPALNQKFDPTLHQAVQMVPAENDDQTGHVVKVLQKGYQYKDRTLRPAMVVVAQ